MKSEENRFSNFSLCKNSDKKYVFLLLQAIKTEYGKSSLHEKKINVSRIRKKTFYLQFCMATPEGHQKSIYNTPKVKKNKDTYGTQAQPKNIKKLLKHQINQSE
jgi:hypothetical protein